MMRFLGELHDDKKDERLVEGLGERYNRHELVLIQD